MSCPCGKECRYIINVSGEFLDSCNKYKICPTYSELEKSYMEWRQRAMNAERDLRTIRNLLVPQDERMAAWRAENAVNATESQHENP
jgi:hypothetical protein